MRTNASRLGFDKSENCNKMVTAIRGWLSDIYITIYYKRIGHGHEIKVDLIKTKVLILFN